MVNPLPNVFSIPELLEHILLQLPMHDLLVHAQRVCRLFRTTIASSFRLQEALFFRSKLHMCDGFHADKETYTMRFERSLNPILRKMFPILLNELPFPCDGCFIPTNAVHLKVMDWNSSPQKCNAYSRHEASWRRMLVSRPPATILGLMKAIEEEIEDIRIHWGTARADTGTTMGILCDFIKEHVHGPRTGFHLHWHMLLDEEELGADIMMQTYDFREDLGKPKQGLWPEIKGECHEPLTVNWLDLTHDEESKIYNHCQTNWSSERSLEMDWSTIVPRSP